MSDSKSSMTMQAGASSGKSLLVALCASGLWYTFDDRLAGMLSAEPGPVGEVPYTMALVIAIIVAMFFALAGLSWNIK